MKTFTTEDIKSWEPCYDPESYVKPGETHTAISIIERDDVPFPDRLWVVCRPEILSDKLMRLFAVWCVRQVQHLMTDERSINAIDVAERFANGLATKEELEAASDAARATASDAARDIAEAAAWAAVRSTAWYVRDAAWYARDAAGEAAWATASDASGDAAWAAMAASRDAARVVWAASRGAAWAAMTASRDAAITAQKEQLIKMIGEEG